jgi:hypothetical protein
MIPALKEFQESLNHFIAGPGFFSRSTIQYRISCKGLYLP